MAYQITTIEELERVYYGLGSTSQLTKANDPLLTTTSGVFNPIFGAYAWAQLNLEANAWGVLPKYPWVRSGWRTIKSKITLTTTNGNTTLGGTAQGGTIAETAKPSFGTMSTIPKTMQLPFEVSEVQDFMATESKDDVWGGLGALRLFAAVQHKEFINRAMLTDVYQSATGATGDYVAGKDFETLDRIVAAKSEADNTNSTWTGYYNAWGLSELNRDAATTYDSTVQSASGTVGTDAVLTDDTFRTFMRKIHKAAGKYPSLFLGSEEAYSEIQGIYTPQVRYNLLGESMVQVDVNGIKTFEGVGVGVRVDTVYGLPYIPTKDAPSNAGDSNEIGRIFALDISDAEGWGAPRLGIMVARPTEYFEASRFTPGWPFVNNAFTERALFRTMGEVICRNFIAQGKIRDIKL